MTQTFTIKNPNDPASQAQLGFLSSLTAERDLPETCEKVRLTLALDAMTKGRANEFISALLKAPKKTGGTNTVQDWGKVKDTVVVDNLSEVQAKMQAEVAADTIAATLTELPAFGYYEVVGKFYYWDVTGKDAKPTLRRLSIVQNYDGSKKGSWQKVYGAASGFQDGSIVKAQQVNGTYTPYAGKHWNYKTPITGKVWVPGTLVVAVQAGVKPLTQAEAAATGKAVGFCIRCGATLTDPVSVAKGIGPVCATYWTV